MANILRQDIGSVVSKTLSNSISSGSYCNSADYIEIDNTTNKALLIDFEYTPTFSTAPTTGVIQLIAVDHSLDGTTAGPAASASKLGRLAGSFNPAPGAGNSSTSWVMTLNSVPIVRKTRFYLYNNGTGQSINSSSVLKGQCWSPGT